MTSLLTAYLILVPAPADEPEPTGAAPTLQYVRFNDQGLFEKKTKAIVYAQEAQTQVVIVNGQQVTRTVLVMVPRTVEQTVRLDSKQYDYYDLDGKKVDESAWKKALSAGAVVLVAADGKAPEAAYRKALKPGTLILVAKTAKIGPAPPVVPQPLPPKR